jgi:hypothetical protein
LCYPFNQHQANLVCGELTQLLLKLAASFMLGNQELDHREYCCAAFFSISLPDTSGALGILQSLR